MMVQFLFKSIHLFNLNHQPWYFLLKKQINYIFHKKKCNILFYTILFSLWCNYSTVIGYPIFPKKNNYDRGKGLYYTYIFTKGAETKWHLNLHFLCCKFPHILFIHTLENCLIGPLGSLLSVFLINVFPTRLTDSQVFHL